VCDAFVPETDHHFERRAARSPPRATGVGNDVLRLAGEVLERGRRPDERLALRSRAG